MDRREHSRAGKRWPRARVGGNRYGVAGLVAGERGCLPSEVGRGKKRVNECEGSRVVGSVSMIRQHDPSGGDPSGKRCWTGAGSSRQRAIGVRRHENQADGVTRRIVPDAVRLAGWSQDNFSGSQASGLLPHRNLRFPAQDVVDFVVRSVAVNLLGLTWPQAVKVTKEALGLEQVHLRELLCRKTLQLSKVFRIHEHSFLRRKAGPPPGERHSEPYRKKRKVPGSNRGPVARDRAPQEQRLSPVLAALRELWGFRAGDSLQLGNAAPRRGNLLAGLGAFLGLPLLPRAHPGEKAHPGE